jgi:hypothetical protein
VEKSRLRPNCPMVMNIPWNELARIPNQKPDRHLAAALGDGSFVPFTAVAGRCTNQTVKNNAAHTPDLEPVEVSEKIDFDRPDFLLAERIRAGITEIFIGLIVLASFVAFCCFH